MSRRDRTHDLNIYAACGCNRGLRRKNNEGNFYFAGEYLDEENDGMGSILTWAGRMGDEYAGEFFAVYDGMGGGQYGEVASYNAACHTEELLGRYTELLAYIAKYVIYRQAEILCTFHTKALV
jgi:serine/threonine protein phosphatase PrpC